MKMVLATGIYPPDIGGPATYVHHLARELSEAGMEVVVMTYGGSSKFQAPNPKQIPNTKSKISKRVEVVKVKKGLPVLRWFQYAKAIRQVGKDADIVYVFSSVSCGVPLWLSGLKKPRKVLRLGGDFGWERYTDWGGKLGLRKWYESRYFVTSLLRYFVGCLLPTFDHIVFSTKFQENMYEKHYRNLPPHSVIENALPEGRPEIHVMHEPLCILFMGRFVAFKNLRTFLEAVKKIDARVTMVGEGPQRKKLQSLAGPRVVFVAPVSGEEKRKIFESHDLMIIPSITEISPNVALEARASGLPVLLTEETGLSGELSEAMILMDLSSVENIVAAVEEVKRVYKNVAQAAAQPLSARTWEVVAGEHTKLFRLMG